LKTITNLFDRTSTTVRTSFLFAMLMITISATDEAAAFNADGRLTPDELSSYVFFKINWTTNLNASSPNHTVDGGLLGIGTDPVTGNHFMYYQLPVDYKDNTWGFDDYSTGTTTGTSQVGGYGAGGGNQHTYRKVHQGDQLGGTGSGSRIVIRPTGTVPVSSDSTLEFNIDLVASTLTHTQAQSNDNDFLTGQLGNTFLGLKSLTQLPVENNGDFFQIGTTADQAQNFIKVATSTSWNVERFGPGV